MNKTTEIFYIYARLLIVSEFYLEEICSSILSRIFD